MDKQVINMRLYLILLAICCVLGAEKCPSNYKLMSLSFPTNFLFSDVYVTCARFATINATVAGGRHEMLNVLTILAPTSGAEQASLGIMAFIGFIVSFLAFRSQ